MSIKKILYIKENGENANLKLKVMTTYNMNIAGNALYNMNSVLRITLFMLGFDHNLA